MVGNYEVGEREMTTTACSVLLRQSQSVDISVDTLSSTQSRINELRDERLC